MKTGGHNKKSNALHEMQGTLNATRHSKPVIDVPPVTAIPPAPKGFDPEQSAKWFEVCTLLFEAGLLARQDLDAVRTYVETEIIQRRAFRQVAEEGGVVSGGDFDKIHPAFLLYERCDKILKPLREQFGFTPRARQSINIKPPEEQEDILNSVLNLN